MDSKQQEANNRQEASKHLSMQARKYFNLIEFDANEALVTEIRKHPIGLLLIILIGVFVSTAILLLTIVISATDLNNLLATGSANDFKGIGVILCFILLIGSIISTLIGVFIYTSNVIFVTSEKIAQVQYASLFNRKISQLSIGDVQDVSVSQKGILAHIFNYGVLVIETAGEQQNYTFTFVPRPYERSKDIVGAHERNLVQYGN